MKLGHKIRKIAHDIYYKNASKKKLEFSLICRDVTAAIDLRQKPKTITDKFRIWLHLNLCQACKNYHDVSLVFSKAIKKNPSQDAERLEMMNKLLMKKFGKSEDKE